MLQSSAQRDRLKQHEDEQGDGVDLAGDLTAEAARVHQEFLHVDRIGIEGEGAAGGQQHDRQRLARMFGEELDQPRLGRAILLGVLEALRLGQATPDVEDDDGEHRAQREGDAPAPFVQRRLGHGRLKDQEDADGEKLSGDQRDILEGREEAAAILARHLGEIGRAGAIFAPDRQALHQARDHQQRRRRQADGGIAGRRRDNQRAHAHQRHRQGKPRLAPLAIGIDAHDPGADRSHDEADREHRRRAQQLGGAVLRGEEVWREVEGEGGVDIPVEPFDEIAGRSADDGFQAVPSGIGDGG